MARSKNNVVTRGLSGMIGDMLVFRQRANKTIVSDKPRPSSKPATATQVAIRERFKRATRYAKSIMSDLILKAAYQLAAKLGQSAHNVAFADYQRSPEFYEDVDLSTYTGTVGDVISVSVMDDFRVEAVHVAIKAAGGAILEQGQAVQSANGLDWGYTVTAANTEVTGTQIIFTARDLPGNETVLEKLMV